MERIYLKKQDYMNYQILKALKERIADSEDGVVYIDRNIIKEISDSLGLKQYMVVRVIHKYVDGELSEVASYIDNFYRNIKELRAANAQITA